MAARAWQLGFVEEYMGYEVLPNGEGSCQSPKAQTRNLAPPRSCHLSALGTAVSSHRAARITFLFLKSRFSAQNLPWCLQ